MSSLSAARTTAEEVLCPWRMAGAQLIRRPRLPSGRGYRAVRCAGCRARVDLCFCEELKPVTLKHTLLSVVMHFLEEAKPTNTAQLGVRVMSPSARILLRGAPGLPFVAEEMISQVSAPAYLLHPGPDSLELTPELARELPRPLHLVVPDGTWGQTRRMLRREPVLRALPSLMLPPGAPSRYRLRRPSPGGGVCTLEALSRTLQLLEGDEVAAELDRIFEVAVERALIGRRG